MPLPEQPFDAQRLASGEVFAELKKIARARLADAGGLSVLNTTALVNESYLRLAGRVDQLHFPSPGHFFAYASRTMRSIIVDLVRESLSERRGGDLQRVTLDSAIDALPAADAPSADEALQVDSALQALQAVDARLAQVVEMRYFAGFSEAEIAQALGLSERTVRRDWDKARAILRTMMA